MAEQEIKLNICYGCMGDLPEGQQVCPSCGYDNNVRQNPENALPEGTVLFRKYLVGKVLGRGGFGVTYLGYDLDLQLTVAIKEYFPREVSHRSSQSYDVQPESGAEDRMVFSKGREVFLDEARTLAKFNSPYIVHVRDFFREHGTAYIVMDYVDGITLKAEMKKNGGQMEPERVLSLMEPLISALEELHEKNIIHRDIKPDNIILARNRMGQYPVLLDFGAARAYLSNETMTMTSVVTHGFSPLEQYSRSSRQGSFTDVYALCATIYNAITGIVPPPASDRNIEGIPLKSISECGVIIAPEKEAAILHGLALRSTERTRTMGQLLEELKGEIPAEHSKNRTFEEAEHPSEVKTTEPAPKSLTEKQGEASSAQNGAGAQNKNKKKPSAAPKIITAFFAGALLLTGIYFGFLRDTDKPDTKSETAKETVVVLTESAQVSITDDNREAELSAFKTVGSIVTFGSYEQDNNTSNGKEDIEWIVLANEGDRSLLISRYSLDVQPYHTEFKAVTWETCWLRSWLNSTFLNEAFTPAEQKAILMTAVDNSESQGSSGWSATGNNTEDRVFLLSYAEAKELFNSDSERACKPTSYAKTRTNKTYTDENGNRSWWLRSLTGSQIYARFINYDGYPNPEINVDSTYPAVRPAFWIDLTSDIF